MEKDESYIITRILAGKTEEYAYFLDTYGQPVFSLIVCMVKSEEDAEELTQDTFMKAFEHLSSFHSMGKVVFLRGFTVSPIIPPYLFLEKRM